MVRINSLSRYDDTCTGNSHSYKAGAKAVEETQVFGNRTKIASSSGIGSLMATVSKEFVGIDANLVDERTVFS